MPGNELAVVKYLTENLNCLLELCTHTPNMGRRTVFFSPCLCKKIKKEEKKRKKSQQSSLDSFSLQLFSFYFIYTQIRYNKFDEPFLEIDDFCLIRLIKVMLVRIQVRICIFNFEGGL